MSNTSANIIQPKFKGRVQRTSYKASKKLAIINEAKKFGILTAAHCTGKISAYPATEEELLKWINELRLVRIAVMAGAIKL
ncbi:75_t:CDS:2 [Ambispora leptoticha]|uniref:75_t:CDS:1 n=1 Tax=Ambispora leptoticha TaxID=144679 RepID=A0A9N9N4G7_9GLOM|nr:75_t:CDS:2 [Ambispora leptoticha]